MGGGGGQEQDAGLGRRGEWKRIFRVVIGGGLVGSSLVRPRFGLRSGQREILQGAGRVGRDSKAIMGTVIVSARQ